MSALTPGDYAVMDEIISSIATDNDVPPDSFARPGRLEGDAKDLRRQAVTEIQKTQPVSSEWVFTYFARRLNRPQSAGSVVPIPAPYTPAEDATIVELFQDGYSINRIAAACPGRWPSSIRRRLATLDLLHGPVTDFPRPSYQGACPEMIAVARKENALMLRRLK